MQHANRGSWHCQQKRCCLAAGRGVVQGPLQGWQAGCRQLSSSSCHTMHARAQSSAPSQQFTLDHSRCSSRGSPTPPTCSTRRRKWHTSARTRAAATDTSTDATHTSSLPDSSQGANSSSNGAQAQAAVHQQQITPGVQDLQAQGRHSHRLIIAYDGTAYSGWQLQPVAPTIQMEIERALMTVTQESRTKLSVGAAGRTDAGVHARGQCVQFYTDKEPDANKLHLRLNALLPPDIRVLAAHRTAPDFHATITAAAKTYRYCIDLGKVQDPTTYRYRMHHPHPCDLQRMQQAAQLLVGTHDFTQFCNHGTDTARRNPVKTIRKLDILPIEGGVMVEVTGEGFLYRQVRHMVGALLAVAGGRVDESHLQQYLQLGAQQLPGAGGVYRGWNVAPAKGLSLHCVHYPANVDDVDTLLYPEYPHDEWGRLIYRLPDDLAGAQTD